jgi:hypothetical protein
LRWDSVVSLQTQARDPKPLQQLTVPWRFLGLHHSKAVVRYNVRKLGAGGQGHAAIDYVVASTPALPTVALGSA